MHKTLSVLFLVAVALFLGLVVTNNTSHPHSPTTPMVGDTSEQEEVEEEVEEAPGLDKEIILDWIQSKRRDLTLTQVHQIYDATMGAAGRFNIDPLLILGMIHQESTFRIDVWSGYGAAGLMQVVPRFHHPKFEGLPYTDIHANIHAGTWVLSDCLRRHGGMQHIRKALACYSGYSVSNVTRYKTRVLSYRAQLLNLINQGN